MSHNLILPDIKITFTHKIYLDLLNSVDYLFYSGVKKGSRYGLNNLNNIEKINELARLIVHLRCFQIMIFIHHRQLVLRLKGWGFLQCRIHVLSRFWLHYRSSRRWVARIHIRILSMIHHMSSLDLFPLLQFPRIL